MRVQSARNLKRYKNTKDFFWMSLKRHDLKGFSKKLRHSLSEYTEIGGFRIKKGVLLSAAVISIFLLLKGPEIFNYVRAFNDTQNVWTFENSTSGSYTSSNSTINDTGAFSQFTNQLANAGFEAGTGSWLDGVGADVDAATFTGSLAKRNSAGPFAQGIMLQGNLSNGSSESDSVQYPRSNTLGGSFFPEMDPNQGSMVFWITPEWNGDDGLTHTIWHGGWASHNRWYLQKSSSGVLTFLTSGGAQAMSVDISSWEAGTTYNVVIRWDNDTPISDSNYFSISIDDVHAYGNPNGGGTGNLNGPFVLGRLGNTSSGDYSPANALIEGFTVYRRVLYDGTHGINVGNGDEIAQIYGGGTAPQDPVKITGSWDVVFSLPTDSTSGAITSGTGNAWTHPHASNLLYTNSTNTGGFMLNVTYTNDGWAQETPLLANAVSYWKLDEASGSRADSIGSNTLTDNNTVTQSPGKLGNAGQFTRANSEYLSITDNSSLSLGSDTDFTITAWVYIDSTGTVQEVVSKWEDGTGNNIEYMLRYQGNANTFRFFVGNGSSQVFVQSNNLGSVSAGQWYFLVAWHDSAANTVNLSVNNGAVDSGSWTGGTQDRGGLFTIGRSGSTSNNYFDGRIDSVGFWKRTLTASERTALYNAGSGLEHPFSGGTITALAANEKVYQGGYKVTSTAENQGIYYQRTVTAGSDWVIRAVGHSDTVCAPRVQLYNQTAGSVIAQLNGTTSSTRGSPNVYLFTGEAPAGMTTLRVRLLNTAASGTCYWHQVELMATNTNMDNTSFEGTYDDESGGGGGTLNIAPTWNSNGMETDATDLADKEISNVHTGSAAQRIIADNNEGVSAQGATLNTAGFHSMGSMVYVNSGSAWVMSGNPVGCLLNDGGTGRISSTVIGAWDMVAGVCRRPFTSSQNLRLAAETTPSDLIFDNAWTFPLTDVSLTVSAANEANSTESTGIRVDGRDTLVQTGLELGASAGSFSFDFTPRHDFDKAHLFGVNVPFIATVYADASNSIIVYRDSDTKIRTQGIFNGTTVNADWNDATTPIVLNAGVTYTFKVTYSNGGDLKLFVDNVQVATAALNASFSTAPTTLYFGNGNTGINQYDATFDMPTAATDNFTVETVNQRYGSQALEVDASTQPVLMHQRINLGGTSNFKLSAYVQDSGAAAVDSSVAQLAVAGVGVSTTYTALDNNWYKLEATFAGTASLRSYGLIVKQGKTILVDDLTLKRNVVSSVYPTTAYSSPNVQVWDILTETVNLTGDNSRVSYQVCNDDPAECDSGDWLFWNGSAWVAAGDENDSNSAETLSTETTVGMETKYPLQWLDATEKKFAFKAFIFDEGESVIKLENTTIGLTTDVAAPDDVDPGTIVLKRDVDSDTIAESDWTNQPDIHVSWDTVTDDPLGSGIYGYCMYVGQDNTVDPSDEGLVNNKGLLGTSPLDVTGTSCDFIVGTGAAIDFANAGYRGSTWLETSGNPYYINLVAIDNAGNASEVVASFEFNYDNVLPEPPDYVSLPSGYVSTKDVTMGWPVSGSAQASDSHSGIRGLQYRINVGGTWYGDSHTGDQDWDDLLTPDGFYTMDPTYDYDELEEGDNIIYIRAWDEAGNVSTEYATGALKLNTIAPSSPRNLGVDPTENTVNAYAFEWDPPETFIGDENQITYCYTVNTLPAANTCAWTGPGVTSLSADAFATQPGVNTFYLVARDEASNVSFGTYAQVQFTYNGEAPGIPSSLEISDISIKATESWRLALSWAEPASVGAGISHYNVFRSETENASCSSNFSQFENVGNTAGTSYIDTDLEQKTYFYCIKACDSANSCGAVSSTVSMLPTGRFFVPAELVVAPKVTDLSTRSATIEWVTDRDSDSKIQFGLESGEYFKDEVSQSDQSVSHSITLSNLDPGTEYFFRAKWTDVDGNTGISSEYLLKTLPAPSVTNVNVVSVDIDSATIQFTTVNSLQADVRYGPTNSYGGAESVNTAFTESTYTVTLNNLEDDTEYHYAMTLYDQEGFDYEILQDNVFKTLPRPEISNVRLQQARDAASPTIVVSWVSNTDISSVVEYYPSDNPAAEAEIASTELVSEHRILVAGLAPQTEYNLLVSGQDARGNKAESELYVFTTATDTRPPLISNVEIEVNEIPVGFSSETSGTGTQIAVSWVTDEPSTSQVEYGEGTGNEYSSRTSEDLTLNTEHVVILSNLNSSSVYHLRVISRDEANNVGRSIDYVTITPKASESGVDVILRIVGQILGG